MARGAFYTPEEDATIRRMVMAGHRPKEIAEALNRSSGAVYERCRRIKADLAPRDYGKQSDGVTEEPLRTASPPRRFSWEAAA